MHGRGRTAAQELTLNALRIVGGFLYWEHGLQKIFGVLGGHRMAYVSLFGAAGFIETIGGALIILGLFSRPVAFVLAGEMAFAFFIAHFPRAQTFWTHFFPITVGGELPVLYCFIFLLVFAFGPGKLSVDGWLEARRDAGAIAGAAERDAERKGAGAS